MKKRSLRIVGLMLAAVLCIVQAYAEKTKQALRALDKGDFEKAEEILTKSIKSDTLNPATHYVFSLLYTDKENPNYNLDTAHLFIQQACEYINLNNEDHLDELDDADLYEYDLKNKKLAIDSIAFVRASTDHTIESYEHFITHYFDAADFAEAVSIRNQLEFENVESIQTWEAYREFMGKFPFASQYSKAKIQYDKLIYDDKTKSGKVDDLETFLVEEPNTPYRHSIEKKIFEDYAGELNTKKILQFLNSYSNPVFSERALNMLYHLDSYDLPDFGDLAVEIQPNFVDSVDQLAQIDEEVLSVTIKNDSFQFINLKGVPFLNENYKAVSENYRCGNVMDDLLVVKNGDKFQLINRMGDVIYESSSSHVDDLGSGLLKIEEEGQIGLIHKSGFKILPAEFEDLRLLENRLLIFQTQGKSGVMSVTGQQYIAADYDRIDVTGSFWVFEKEGFFGVSNLKAVQNAKDSLFQLELPYEEVELINYNYIIGFDEDEEVLINNQLEILSPPATRRINTRNETWVLEMESGYTTFDPEQEELSTSVYHRVLQNMEWLGLTRHGKWVVYNKSIYDEPIIGIDSVKLLGDDMAIVFRGSSGLAIFPNKKVVEVSEDQYLMSIGPKIKTNRHYLVIRENGENVLYRDGEELFRIACDEIGYISDSAFYVKKGGQYGAVDLRGQLTMRIRYDAISAADDEVAPVLYNGRFGGYNFRDRVLLRIEYEEKLKPYSSNLLIAKKDGKYGLLNRFNEVLVEPSYDEIQYWSDSMYLGQNNEKWELVNLRDGKKILTEIEYFEYIKKSPDEKILLIRRAEGYGVYHSSKGVIIPTVFHDVINLGNAQKQLYFTETTVSEADMYVVVYYDTDGNKLFSEAYREDVYEKLVCED